MLFDKKNANQLSFSFKDLQIGKRKHHLKHTHTRFNRGKTNTPDSCIHLIKRQHEQHMFPTQFPPLKQERNSVNIDENNQLIHKYVFCVSLKKNFLGIGT